MEPARVELLAGIERARSEGLLQDGGAWIYVSVDREDGHLVNAAGFWGSEPDAGLAAATDPDADCTHHVVPLFVTNPPRPG